jgi:hypothetical protein
LWMFATFSHEDNDATEVGIWIDTRTSRGWSTFYVNFLSTSTNFET